MRSAAPVHDGTKRLAAAKKNNAPPVSLVAKLRFRLFNIVAPCLFFLGAMWQKAFDLPIIRARNYELYLNKILLKFDSN
jgi:hypothetical protein